MHNQAVLTLIQAEHAVFDSFRTLVPPAVQKNIEARVAAWQAAVVVAPPLGLAKAQQAISGVLVMRPGTIPRPIDDFFFEVINRV